MKIALRGVTKRFGRLEALKAVDLEVPSGTRVALVGPNGSGKSTLTRILMGLLSCEGSVQLDGLAPSRQRVRIASQMAYVPQIPPHLSAPVGELMGALCGVRLLDPQALVETAARLELDVQKLARTPFRSLSGGMKQKLLLALALTTQARLMILDEPTSSLDVEARQRFYRLFEERVGEATLILCSHRLEEIRHLVTHVVALEEGRLRYFGPVDQLLARQAKSVLEVCVTNGACNGWLEAQGFQQGAAGWWRRTVDHSEKLRILPELTGALGERLANLLVRDLERIETGGEGDGEDAS